MPEPSTPPPLDPYATPRATSTPPPIPNPFAQYLFRDGSFLVVRDGAQLPMSCVKTGTSVADGAWRKRKMIAWNPPWVFVGLLGGVVPLLILMLVCQKKAHIAYSLSDDARRTILGRRSVGFVLLALFVLALYLVISESVSGDVAGTVLLGGVVSLILSLVFFISATPLRATGHRNGWFRIKGAGSAFLDQLPTADWRSL